MSGRQVETRRRWSRRFKLWRENDHLVLVENVVELNEGLAGWLLLLGTLSSLDNLAKAAGMFAVESFRNRLGEWRGLGKTQHHADPGHGLQQSPVQAERKRERDHEHNFRQPEQHGRLIASGV